eukprot:scaffold17586_cov63-Phaeocystis_antarctica.AAC.1
MPLATSTWSGRSTPRRQPARTNNSATAARRCRRTSRPNSSAAAGPPTAGLFRGEACLPGARIAPPPPPPLPPPPMTRATVASSSATARYTYYGDAYCGYINCVSAYCGSAYCASAYCASVYCGYAPQARASGWARPRPNLRSRAAETGSLATSTLRRPTCCNPLNLVEPPCIPG